MPLFLCKQTRIEAKLKLVFSYLIDLLFIAGAKIVKKYHINAKILKK